MAIFASGTKANRTRIASLVLSDRCFCLFWELYLDLNCTFTGYTERFVKVKIPRFYHVLELMGLKPDN